MSNSAVPWTVAHRAPLSMGFPRQEYWSGLPLPPPEDLPHPGIKPAPPVSPASQVDSLPAEPLAKPTGMYEVPAPCRGGELLVLTELMPWRERAGMGTATLIHGARNTKMKSSTEKHKKTAREEKIQRETQRC